MQIIWLTADGKHVHSMSEASSASVLGGVLHYGIMLRQLIANRAVLFAGFIVPVDLRSRPSDYGKIKQLCKSCVRMQHLNLPRLGRDLENQNEMSKFCDGQRYS